jgi:hypothetical protein
MIGFKSMAPVLAGTYLSSLDQWTKLYGFDADTGQYYVVGSGDMMTPTEGYWLAVPGAAPGDMAGTIYP